jgi:hypothetical protein
MLESGLTRLEEFETFMDSIKSNNQVSADTLIPLLVQRADDLERLFAQVDKLEAFVSMIDGQVSAMEKRSKDVSDKYGWFNKFLGSFLDRNKRRRSMHYEWTEPEIFNTSDYISTPSAAAAATTMADTNASIPDSKDQHATGTTATATPAAAAATTASS